jgi:hypothetical protein
MIDMPTPKMCFLAFPFILSALCAMVCRPAPNMDRVVIEAENFTHMSGSIEVFESEENGQYVTSSGGGDWLAYDVNMPVAGRYRCEIRAISTSATPESSTCWIEDYTDNPDDRTYDITGRIPVPLAAEHQTFDIVFKEGSPLTAGPHKIKLHFDGGGIKVDWIQFSLMKRHQITATTLTQSTTGSEYQQMDIRYRQLGLG